VALAYLALFVGLLLVLLDDLDWSLLGQVSVVLFVVTVVLVLGRVDSVGEPLRRGRKVLLIKFAFLEFCFQTLYFQHEHRVRLL
jgi:hypothetical protein